MAALLGGLDGERRRKDAKRNVEGVKAVMAAMAVPGYTSHADSARELLVKMPSLREHFEALSAAAVASSPCPPTRRRCGIWARRPTSRRTSPG